MSSSSTRRFYCERLLQAEGWRRDAVVTLAGDGSIIQIDDEGDPTKADVVLSGAVIPGFQNAHSHAFQYAMAGHAEYLPKGAGDDDFWSWRDAMYRLALSVSPALVKAIAGLLYAEMLRHGYTAVAEFHYLHHDIDGTPYDDLALMGRCLVEAADEAGIRLTLVPVWYRQGGFGKAAQPHQRRFLCDSLHHYQRLLEASEAAVSASPLASLGMGIHSLRAVAPEAAREAFAAAPPELPRHIHVAEQQGEVDAAIEALGKRPVQWLLDNVYLDPRFHLVHATHLDQQEVAGIATSGAHVVLCPSTEGNLGDGFFPLGEFMKRGGRWSIGTDSHVGLSPHEELRLLDYGHRLQREKRNVLCAHGGEDSGTIALTTAWHAGRAAMGASTSDFFTPGLPFDAIVYDLQHPHLATTPPERLLSTLIYAFDSAVISHTIVGGEVVVKDQRHARWDSLSRQYLDAMARS